MLQDNLRPPTEKFGQLRRSPYKVVQGYLTFLCRALGAALPAFLDWIPTAEFWTLNQRTADFTIITPAFWCAGAWRPSLTVLV